MVNHTLKIRIIEKKIDEFNFDENVAKSAIKDLTNLAHSFTANRLLNCVGL